MDDVPTIKAEELKPDPHEEVLELDTDEEAAKLDLDEQELALQLQILQHRRRRLENEAKQRKRTARSTGPHPARSVSHIPEIKQRSTTPFKVPPSTVVVELLSDNEEPQVKVEAEQSPPTGTGVGLEAIPPVEQDTEMTDVANVVPPEPEKEQHAASRSTVQRSPIIPTQSACITPATGEKQQKTPLVSTIKAKKRRPRKSRLAPDMKVSSSTSKLVQKGRHGPSQSGVMKSPAIPKKKRLTIKEQLTQELEDLHESSPPPDTCGRGARTRPSAGTYRIQLGLTQEDIQSLLAHFCMRTLDHVCSHLSDNGQVSLEKVSTTFGRPRQRLTTAEYSSMEEFVKDIRSIMETQVCRDCDRQYISHYLWKQQSNWNECKEECETKSNDEERSKIVDEWAVFAEKS